MPPVPRPPREETPPKPPTRVRPGGGGSTTPPPKPPPAARRPAGAPPAPRTSTTDAKLRESIAEWYVGLGMGAATFGAMRRDPGIALAGVNIAHRSEQVADNWIEACRQNPRLRQYVTTFLEAGSVAKLVSAHVMMLAPIAVSIVPHPALRPIANMSIVDDAHTDAMQLFPDLFMTPEQYAAAQAAAAAATPQPNGHQPS